jgi:hypothetical protein
MHPSHAIRQASKIRSQLLTCSTLAVALLFETRGLMEDLSMAQARATVRAETSTTTLGGSMQPKLDDQGPARPIIESLAMKPDPDPMLSDDGDHGSTAPTDEMSIHGGRRRTARRSVALAPYSKRYLRSRFLSHLQSSGECSQESLKTP